MINLFGQTPTPNTVFVQRVKAWIREMLALSDEVAITVMQLNCAEADCPDVETVVGVLEKGHPRKFTIFKPLAAVTRDDLAAALRQSNPEESP